MILLYQFAWSPFCLIQRRILEFGRIPFRTVRVSLAERSDIWRLTRERYYQVPVLRHGRQILFEVDAHSQVLAKYLDSRFDLGLFPSHAEGVQDLLWRHFEGDLEQVAFRLNDIYWEDFVPRSERCGFIRHKERAFGRGCLQEWRRQQPDLLARLATLLVPAEKMLRNHPFLLADRPVFVDFCLFGVLANFMFSKHYELPAGHGRLREWYARISAIQQPVSS